MIKTAVVKTLKKKLLDIAKYLEEAGMCGAKELRKAMDAIDGSFADDADYSVDQMIPDNQLALPGSMPVALHGGEGGRPSTLNPGESVVVVGIIMQDVIMRLIKTANKLDESEHHDEADEIDELLKELLDGEDLEIIKDLEEIECNKKKQRVKPEDKDKEGDDVVARSNGLVPTSVSQTSGFNGLSDAYFYSGYGNLEAPYK